MLRYMRYPPDRELLIDIETYYYTILNRDRVITRGLKLPINRLDVPFLISLGQYRDYCQQVLDESNQAQD